MQKSLSTVCRNYFSIKSYSTFSAKMCKESDGSINPGFTIRKCILDMVYFIPYNGNNNFPKPSANSCCFPLKVYK